MAYLHCHTKDCGWSQDDFWSSEEGEYSPFRPDLMRDLQKALFKEKVYFDKWAIDEMGIINNRGKDDNGYWVNGREFVINRLEAKVRSIRNMIARTEDEWKEKKDTLTCPKCGEQNWDID